MPSIATGTDTVTAVDEPRPRMSILIPNYDNGRASSRTGDRDLIGDLLRSLETTLADETTPWEILAHDDGSTDDSRATLRAWAEKRRPDGQPFLTLTEGPHDGCLARIANRLVRAARGEFIARIDGDVICRTPGWVSRLVDRFDAVDASVGILGPKQLRIDGRIHACGDWILDPRGYRHHADGLPPHVFSAPLEVDHVMGCFYVHRRAVFDDLGGYDEDFLRGQTIDFGLRARLAGWRCLAVPDVEFVHAHGQRKGRATRADSSEGVRASLETFRVKWGFDRLAPDLDVVRGLYGGTPLCWNRRWFDTPAETSAAGEAPVSETSEWDRFGSDPDLQQRIRLRLAAVEETRQQVDWPKGRLVHLGCGDGVLAHLLAERGHACVGVTTRPERAERAASMTSRRTYAGGTPSFRTVDWSKPLPWADGSAAGIVVSPDVLDHHPNPGRLLREAARLLEPGGILVATAGRCAEPIDEADPSSGPAHPWRLAEVARVALACGGLTPIVDLRRDAGHVEVLFIARRTASPLAPALPAPAVPRRPRLASPPAARAA